MNIYRIRFSIGGGHIHCRLFVSKSINHNFALCGTFVVSKGEEFKDLMKSCQAVEFLGDEPEKDGKEYMMESEQTKRLKHEIKMRGFEGTGCLKYDLELSYRLDALESRSGAGADTGDPSLGVQVRTPAAKIETVGERIAKKIVIPWRLSSEDFGVDICGPGLLRRSVKPCQGNEDDLRDDLCQNIAYAIDTALALPDREPTDEEIRTLWFDICTQDPTTFARRILAYRKTKS